MNPIMNKSNLTIVVPTYNREAIIKTWLEHHAIKKDYLKSLVFRCYPSIEKIKKINWTPTVSIEEGFKRTIDSFIKK